MNCSSHRNKKGVALLTVLAFLSIFAVVMVAFVYSIRIEEVTSQNYADSVNIQQASEAAIQGVLSQVSRDLDPSRPNMILGRPQPRYVSEQDPWAIGYAGKVGDRVTYVARSHQIDARPEAYFQRANLTMLPTPIPLGIDEDPAGDQTGFRRVAGGRNQNTGSGDGYPGLQGIDDDLDGIVDADGDSQFVNDDDEDYIVDEDTQDARRPDTRGNSFFPPGSGYDQDGDRLGVFDESAKININFAGNNFGTGGGHTYNLGVSPAELDLPLFLMARIYFYSTANGNLAQLNEGLAAQLAERIVNYRYGDVANGGGGAPMRPGVEGQDDNNNGSPSIVNVEEFSRVFRTSTFDGEPFAVIGNGLDDDEDGMLNEEDERYIGPATNNTSGTPLNEPIGDTSGDMRDFRPGDKIDNNGNGFIDEPDEGTDDPAEFNVFKPKGNDRPFATVEDLEQVNGIFGGRVRRGPGQPPSLYEILMQSTTIYSQSDEISGPLSAVNNDVAKINPNLISNWRPTDVWDLSNAGGNRVDFQYSPPVRLEDLLPLQVDNDGDWQATAEPDVLEGNADGIDQDGDGLIDEPSDDWDGNFYPSGDFDGYSEPEVGTSAMQNGVDDDGDGVTQDEPRSGNWPIRKLRQLGDTDPTRPRDEVNNEIRLGMVAEGDGIDNDGDGIIDDDGDFNADGMITYDPEWHVNEDAYGDMSGDGYPGLGADPDSPNNTALGDIVERPSLNHDLLVTNFADDDWDGYADFYDPQVLAAMYAPELDGVDNDNDGEVDEVGERYIAAYDDDEDGIMNEDPPEFQIALNMIDFIDSWGPFKPANDPDVRRILGVSDDDAVLGDPVTTRSFELYSTRQRAFRMHPRILAGINQSSRESQLFTEQMRLLLPNPPQTGMRVKYEGIEAIRINEVMPKPVIRLEAEEVLSKITYNPAGSPPATVEENSDRFTLIDGGGDNGSRIDVQEFDTNWGRTRGTHPTASNPNISFPGFIFAPDGFRHTQHPLVPFVSFDSLAPSFIFSVTNIVTPPALSTQPEVGARPEIAEWKFNNIPAGLYDVVIYMHPSHRFRPEVTYTINGKVISFRSDYQFVNGAGVLQNYADLLNNDPIKEQIRRDTAIFQDSDGKKLHQTDYRLTPYPLADQQDVTNVAQRVEVGQNGELTLRITANTPTALNGSYGTSFDRIELFNPRVQYVELENISTDDIDLSGWQVNTPYGHYVLPRNTVIKRMKPAWKNDQGRDIVVQEGIPGNGVPFEPLMRVDKLRSGTITSTDRLLEDNKILLAYDKGSLVQFINTNYPAVQNLDQIVVEPEMATVESNQIQASINTFGALVRPDAQHSDVRFKLVDKQEDVLTHNAQDKFVTLYDRAGNYIDSFKYRTTFNNVIVDIAGNRGADIVALPGYRGFESFERADTTHFETQMQVNNNTGQVSAARSVPSSIKLDAVNARIVEIGLNSDGAPVQGNIGGYTAGNDPNNNSLQRFKDDTSVPTRDSQWKGWDFIGDWHVYSSERGNADMPSRNSSSTVFYQLNAMAREAALPTFDPARRYLPVQFYQMLGGFENMTDFVPLNFPTPAMTRQEIDMEEQQSRRAAPITAFVWRFGIRELIRAGFDPDVDDQLTVRMLGRDFVAPDGTTLYIDMPVGEVMTTPVYRIINPGGTNEGTALNPYSNFFEVAGGGEQQTPIFAKLRNGDTAFTIDLRQNYSVLTQDLKTPTGDEPIVEIAVFMRKSTRDLSPTHVSYSGQPGIFNIDRPEFLLAPGVRLPVDNNGFAGFASYIDDNYFFKGIELFGRGRQDDDDSLPALEKRALLAGTPGRDNTGYVPAYARRRYMLDGRQRDEFDISDNTAYVKNAPLATLGEISRLYTGNKFETINTPRIPQRVEDRSVTAARIYTTGELVQRSRNNTNAQYRIELAQRERLDQWENQYNLLYSMITTAESVVVPGLININTAPREVLIALPFSPLLDDNRMDTPQNRYDFNALVADFIIEGRQPTGRDGAFGIHDLNDSEFINAYYNRRSGVDRVTDYKLSSIGRTPGSYKNFDIISQRVFDPLNIRSQDIKQDTLNFTNRVYTSAIVSEPDDGPYPNIGTLLAQMTHLKRRERLSQSLRRDIDRTGDRVIDGTGDLRERLNLILRRELTPEDMEDMMNRVSSLVTVRSRAFNVISRGRIFDVDGNIVAQRKLETVYQR